jgi:hypothetical protein
VAAVAAASGGHDNDHSFAPSGAAGRPLPNHHRWGADTKSEAIGDHLPPSVHKIEFPKFDGTGDPMAWLSHCECYFVLHDTPEHQHVQYTSFYLLDYARLWYHRLELNGGSLSWPHFV